MTTLETMVCNMCEDHYSWDIYALISELQMIADRKFQEEEENRIRLLIMDFDISRFN